MLAESSLCHLGGSGDDRFKSSINSRAQRRLVFQVAVVALYTSLVRVSHGNISAPSNNSNQHRGIGRCVCALETSGRRVSKAVDALVKGGRRVS